MEVSGRGHDAAVEAPSRDETGDELVEAVAQEAQNQIERVQEARNRGVPVPQTNAERQLGSAQVPPAPAGTPGGPPSGTAGGPPSDVAPVEGRTSGRRRPGR